jgi:hypothetical protein
VDEALEVLREIIDPVEREHYLQRLAGVVGMHESGLREKLNRLVRGRLSRRRPARPESASSPQPSSLYELPEAYALALVFLEGPASSELIRDEVRSPIGRELLRSIAVQGSYQANATTLQELAESVDPVLAAGFAAVGVWVVRLSNLAPEQRQRELEVAGLKLRQQRLKVQHEEVLALLNDPERAEQKPTPAALLASVAAQLREIESALAARDGVGSLVWRSRQLGEALGG